MFIQIENKTKQDIINLYKSGLSLADISKKIKLSTFKIKQVLKEVNIPIKRISGNKGKTLTYVNNKRLYV